MTQPPGEPDPVLDPAAEGSYGQAAPHDHAEPAASIPYWSSGQPAYAAPGQVPLSPYGQPPYASFPPYPGAPYGPPWQMARDPALAEWWQRLLARIIDSIILFALLSPLYGAWFVSFFHRFINLAHRYPIHGQHGAQQAFGNALSQMTADTLRTELLITLAAAALSFGYDWLQHGLWGQTIGKRAVGTKVVTANGHAPISGRAACGRAAVYALVPGVPFVGGIFALANELWLLWDPQRQCLHDKAARTVVVKKDMLAAASVTPRT